MRNVQLFTWLLAGTALLILAQGRWLWPPALWLAAIALVRFTRDAPTWCAFVGFVVAHTIALEVAYLGMVPLPTAAHIGLFTGISLIMSGVFLLDRAVARRRGTALWTTLVLPAGWVTFDYLTGTFSPNGSWGSIGYGLVEQLPAAQIASITGWTGLTFLVAWPGTVVHWAWQRRAGHRPVTGGLATVAGVYAAVLIFGLTRPAAPSSPALRTALLAAPDTFQGEHLEEVWRYTRGYEQSATGRQQAIQQIADWQDRHFAAVRDAIAQGAELVTWAEVNAAFTTAEEASWIDRARQLAEEEAVWIGLGLAVFRPRTGESTQNRFILVRPDGDLAWDYHKATRVPGDGNEVGDGVLPRVEATPNGRWSAAICFDMDFPRLLQQAGAMDTDLLIAPSNDWTEARHTHARMARVRAIEQGFHLVRPTKDGIALVADALGRVIAQDDTDVDRSRQHVLLADVPTRGVTTIYSRIGDAFAWLCCGVFAVGAALGLRRPR